MKTQHTEGNWHSHDGQIYPEQTGKTLALIPYFDKENEEQQANAKLIAAAPELLEALQQAVKEMEQINNIYPERVLGRLDQARAAIQKATN